MTVAGFPFPLLFLSEVINAGVVPRFVQPSPQAAVCC